MKDSTKALLLTLCPLVIMSALGFSLLHQGEVEDARSMFAAGVIVASTAGASIIYQVEKWSLPKRSTIHFLIMTVTVLPALLLSGWFALATVTAYFGVIGLFLLVGAVAWTIGYLVHKKTEAA